MKLCLGLLLSNGFPVPAPFVLGLCDVFKQALTGEANVLLPVGRQIDAIRVISSQGFPIDTARNEVCRLFLDEDDAEYLLFLDADMRHPGDIAHRLVKHGLPLVTGRYQMRKPPFKTVALRRTGDGLHDYQAIADERGLVKVDAAGAGALLIHRTVLDAIRVAVGDDWFRYQAGPSGLRTVSEDMWFFQQAAACGIQAYADLDTVSTHVASFEIDPSWHQPWRQAYGEAKARLEHHDGVAV